MLLALTWPNISCCSHLESESADRCSLPFCLSLSNLPFKWIILKKKKNSRFCSVFQWTFEVFVFSPLVCTARALIATYVMTACKFISWIKTYYVTAYSLLSTNKPLDSSDSMYLNWNPFYFPAKSYFLITWHILANGNISSYWHWNWNHVNHNPMSMSVHSKIWLSYLQNTL